MPYRGHVRGERQAHTIVVEPEVELADLSTLVEVRQPSGAALLLQSEREQRFYENAVRRYMEDFHYTLASDLRTLDRLVFVELMMFRWSCELAAGSRDGKRLSHDLEDDIRRNMKDSNLQISKLQNDLGMTYRQRKLEQLESLPAYLARLKEACVQFGKHREDQLLVALDLFNEILSGAGTLRRSNEHERRRLRWQDADMFLEWLDNDVRAEFNKVDEHFRTHQKTYIRTLA
jgi:hypothetical protein